jgi:hypothetical protein
MSKHRTFWLSLILLGGLQQGLSAGLAQEVYGPPNLLKTTPTPFGAPVSKPAGSQPGQSGNEMTIDLADGNSSSSLKLPMAPSLGQMKASDESSAVNSSPIDINDIQPSTQRASLRDRLSSITTHSLSEKLVQSRIYLPGRMVLGQPAEFVIKGKPGAMVALAMSQNNTGAKPIYGHSIRLGADRKLVGIGQLSDSGITTLIVSTPIEGDLIGEHLYFEAALWNKSDFSDVEIAEAVGSEGQSVNNGVSIAADIPHKKGPKLVPASSVPFTQLQTQGLGSGKP